MIDADKLDYAKKYLRRTQSLAQLKQLAAQVWATATDTVTLTSNNFEGGGASGVVTFEKALIGKAVEDLIIELDSTAANLVPGTERYMNFGSQPVQT